MPLSYDEFMRKTNGQGFTPEEQELLGNFGRALETAYTSMCAEDKDSKEYKEHTEVREALGEMQGNSVFEPLPDEEEEEKKKKWDEDMQRLVGFINTLRSGRNLSYFSDHAVGIQNGQLKNGRQYFSLLELLNEKLEAKLNADEHRELFSGYQQQPTNTASAQEHKESEKVEKSEPLTEQARLEIEERNWQIKEEILEDWSYVGDVDDIGSQGSFQTDLLKVSKGLNVKQMKLMDNSAKELHALKNAIIEYNIYLMNRSDGIDDEHSESKYLKDIVDAAEKYIQKKRGDDPLHPEKNKPDSWKPMFKNAKECFTSAKDVLELTKGRLKIVEQEEKKAEAADPDELLEKLARNGRKSLRKRRRSVNKPAEKERKSTPAAEGGEKADKKEHKALQTAKKRDSKVAQRVAEKVGRNSVGETVHKKGEVHKRESGQPIKRTKTFSK